MTPHYLIPRKWEVPIRLLNLKRQERGNEVEKKMAPWLTGEEEMIQGRGLEGEGDGGALEGLLLFWVGWQLSRNQRRIPPKPKVPTR